MMDLLNRFAGCPVLVIGDVMLDEFVWGQVNRISPEAPVPVVEVQRRSYTVGGAANTAANVASLGGKAILAGIIGTDANGQQVLQMLQKMKIDANALLADADRPTTTKTRIIAHSQQMVRIDQEKPGYLAEQLEEQLLRRIQELLPQVSSCVISDYGKGIFSPTLTAKCIQAANDKHVPVIVDPKGTNYEKYRGATLVKPNQLEAGKVLNRELYQQADVDQAGQDLLKFLGKPSALLITQGAQGMALFEPGQSPVQIPAQAREVYDVTGAGDTVAGTLALSLAVGGSLTMACQLASLAAAIVVGKVGTATCSINELRASAQVARW